MRWWQPMPRRLAQISSRIKATYTRPDSSALRALTTFAWTIPALHRIEVYIEPWNGSSIRVAEASGYQREGLLRSHQEIGGIRRDMLLYAVTRP